MIEHREGVRGGRPVIEDTKIGVVQLHEMVREENMDIETVVDSFAGKLPRAEVEAALDYYDKHEKEMQEIQAEMRETWELALDEADKTEIGWPDGMSERELVESVARAATQPHSADWIAEATEVDPALAEDVLSSLVEEGVFVETDEGYRLDEERLREEKRDRLEEMPEAELREELERIDRENTEWRDE